MPRIDLDAERTRWQVQSEFLPAQAADAVPLLDALADSYHTNGLLLDTVRGQRQELATAREVLNTINTDTDARARCALQNVERRIAIALKDAYLDRCKRTLEEIQEVVHGELAAVGLPAQVTA